MASLVPAKGLVIKRNSVIFSASQWPIPEHHIVGSGSVVFSRNWDKASFPPQGRTTWLIGPCLQVDLCIWIFAFPQEGNPHSKAAGSNDLQIHDENEYCYFRLTPLTMESWNVALLFCLRKGKFCCTLAVNSCVKFQISRRNKII